jgi:hypothetical protein
LCIVARDVTEVTWPFHTVAQSSVYRVTSQRAVRSEARGREGRQEAAVLHYCCAIAFLEVSEFRQLSHGAITPHCSHLVSPLLFSVGCACNVTFLWLGSFRGDHSPTTTSAPSSRALVPSGSLIRFSQSRFIINS